MKRMVELIRGFVQSPDKKILIKTGLEMTLFKIRYGLVINHIGKRSYVSSVDRLIGAKNLTIGDGVYIGHHARIEAHDNWNGKSYWPNIIIEDNVSVGQNLHLAAIGKLCIGKGTVISGNVLITDIEHIYSDIDKSISQQDIQHKLTYIGENCFIGYGAVIQAGTVLGKHCIVGSNAVLKGEYPDYCVIVGVPGKVVKKYSFEDGKWIRI